MSIQILLPNHFRIQKWVYFFFFFSKQDIFRQWSRNRRKIKTFLIFKYLSHGNFLFSDKIFARRLHFNKQNMVKQCNVMHTNNVIISAFLLNRLTSTSFFSRELSLMSDMLKLDWNKIYNWSRWKKFIFFFQIFRQLRHIFCLTKNK